MERSEWWRAYAEDLIADGVTRRSFMKLVGGSLALAGVAGCVPQPEEAILPYVRQPPDVIPGLPQLYATSMLVGGLAHGLLVTSHTGRPVKVEGNPDHPATLGATGVVEQASVLGLYDPHRARGITRRRAPSSWSAFAETFGGLKAGQGLHVLLEPTSSPLVLGMLARLQQTLPGARATFFAPGGPGAMLDGNALAFGRPLQAIYDLSRAEVIVALDADFLADGPFHVRYSRDFAGRRRVTGPASRMNRLYSVGAVPTPTSVVADHRLRVRASQVGAVAAELAAELTPGGAGHALPLPAGDLAAAFVRAAVADLRRAGPAALVVAGEGQPPAVHALAALTNAALGAAGTTVRYVEPVLAGAQGGAAALAALAEEIRAGRVHTLVVLEGNPAYTAPADLELPRLLRQVARSAYLGLYENETARDCAWFVPAAHYLESWGDGRAWDGTLSAVQPLVQPLYGGRSPAEILGLLAGDPRPARALLAASWPAQEGAFDAALQRGLLPGTEAPAVTAVPRTGAAAVLAQLPRGEGDALEVVLRPHPVVGYGTHTNNPWLLELPAPLTKLTWGNAALLSPKTAGRLGVTQGDIVELQAGGRALRLPALVLPGHADEAITVELGFGREGGEASARGVGANGYRLSSAAAPFWQGGARLTRTGGRQALALTQTHFTMEGRPLALATTLGELRRDPDLTRDHRGPLPTLLPIYAATGDQWAMTIDLSVCTGCSSCVVACQAENNTMVVGPRGVLGSREMHWLRIDRYFSGPADDPQVLMQPMLCQHCEQAPCEYVCPVNATVHSPDGLNEMVYNRCIGTRFCSNNCPYKVRRFNWFDYREDLGPRKLAMNPEVTVRERGVMEKCTYCVQRIRRAEITARNEGRPIRDGEVVTACQQACPTQAIVFGSIGDPTSKVTATRRLPQRYEVLHDQGTRPRTLYLARISNPSGEGEP